ncbi:MAG: hypothetical protein ACREMD_00875 [Gemmatimonadota bacterium]
MKRTFVAPLALAGLTALLWLGCTGDGPTTPSAPNAPRGGLVPAAGPDLAAARAANKKHGPGLRARADVVGTAVGLGADGKPTVKLFVTRPGVADLPARLDDVPVVVEVTGMFVALSDPTTRARPAPLGFSVGHPAITAGTIGARVTKNGNVYVLSNNHVLANGNDANIGDGAIQPGDFDGGSDPADRIGTLAEFQPINFSGGVNFIDAAIAISTTADLGNATPTDDAYGTPSSTIFGDANSDGVFDDTSDLLGVNVQKYGRTTELTTGQISEIDVSVEVCYEVVFIFCTKSALFQDQIAIGSATFSDGGDSGSLIVTNDSGKNPVALLFAGSDTRTLANRIDLVLNEFGVTIDGEGGAPPPPPPPPPSGTMHVGDLDGSSSSQGQRWTATVAIQVHDDAHGNVSGATVSGQFSNGTRGKRSCTTDAGGSCSVERSRIRNTGNSVTFTVDDVTHASQSYEPSANHDPDGDSDGTSINVDP